MTQYIYLCASVLRLLEYPRHYLCCCSYLIIIKVSSGSWASSWFAILNNDHFLVAHIYTDILSTASEKSSIASSAITQKTSNCISLLGGPFVCCECSSLFSDFKDNKTFKAQKKNVSNQVNCLVEQRYSHLQSLLCTKTSSQGYTISESAKYQCPSSYRQTYPEQFFVPL